MSKGETRNDVSLQKLKRAKNGKRTFSVMREQSKTRPSNGKIIFTNLLLRGEIITLLALFDLNVYLSNGEIINSVPL